jgi:hypothetical protein
VTSRSAEQFGEDLAAAAEHAQALKERLASARARLRDAPQIDQEVAQILQRYDVGRYLKARRLVREEDRFKQALGVMPDVIDRCQNHVLAGSRVRRHYLKHDYADETKQAWGQLGAAIEAALAQRLRFVSGST